MPEVHLIQIDITDQSEAERELKVWQQWEHWLVSEIANQRQEVEWEYQTRSNRHMADMYAKGASSAIEEMSRKLEWVREQIKKVSATARLSRDAQENTLNASLAQVLTNHKEA